MKIIYQEEHIRFGIGFQLTDKLIDVLRTRAEELIDKDELAIDMLNIVDDTEFAE